MRCFLTSHTCNHGLVTFYRKKMSRVAKIAKHFTIRPVFPNAFLALLVEETAAARNRQFKACERKKMILVLEIKLKFHQ
jgi:hypothetical protein